MRRSILLMILPFGLLFAQSSRKEGSSNGEQVFQEQCASCHGTDGKGQTEMGKNLQAADLTSEHVQHMTDEELSATIAKGKEKMPAFGDKLAEGEIRAVVQYIRGLGKKQ